MADFTIQPNSAIDEEPMFATYVEQYESGVEQRRARHSDSLRKWHLIYTNRTQAQFESMRDFFLGKKGKLTSFTWENPNDSTEYTVRFDTDNIIFKRAKYNLWNWEFDLLEVK